MTPSSFPSKARERALDCLAQGETLRHSAATHAQSAETAAAQQAQSLRAALPGLARAAQEAATPDEKHEAQRAYLQGQNDLARLEQAFQIARRQRLQAGEPLAPDAVPDAPPQTPAP